MRAAQLGAALALLPVLGGCMDAGVAWSYSIAPSVGDPVVLSAAIQEDTCASGNEPPLLHFFERGDLPILAPRRLAEGSHCFVIEAFDDGCLQVGGGETDVDLPSSEPTVHVEVSPLDEPIPSAACAAYLNSRR